LITVAIDFDAELLALRSTFGQIEAVLDPTALGSRIAELEVEASAPGLWDDQDNAQAVTSALSIAKADVDRIRTFANRIDDLSVLVEMGTEGDDAETLAEAEADLAVLKKDLAAMEVRTLMTGEWDERDAVVTVRSGAGGVDAADFTAMLMRMYLRWAERHGYAAKVLDTSYAEEAGIKSATFEVSAPYAFGHLSVEAGTHRLVRISPFDNQGELCCGRGHPAHRPDGPYRGSGNRHQDRRLPLIGSRRPIGQHDRLRRPDHAPSVGHCGVDAG
jgi:peptide chain release factor 2